MKRIISVLLMVMVFCSTVFSQNWDIRTLRKINSLGQQEQAQHSPYRLTGLLTRIKKGTEMIHVPALDVKNVADTTGAGDYFAAGFLYGLLGGYSFEKCGKIGSILSGRVIQTIGASLTDRAWAKVREDVGNVIA